MGLEGGGGVAPDAAGRAEDKGFAGHLDLLKGDWVVLEKPYPIQLRHRY
jgi:hypothetical protein